MSAPTPTQQQVYEYIVKCLEVEHHFPMLPQISDDFGWRSLNVVFDVVAQLEKKGYLTRNARGKHMLAKHILRVIPCETSLMLNRPYLPIKTEVTYGTTPGDAFCAQTDLLKLDDLTP
jgi:hypothetical protein